MQEFAAAAALSAFPQCGEHFTRLFSPELVVAEKKNIYNGDLSLPISTRPTSVTLCLWPVEPR